jgi:hypothetical protein
MEMHVTPCGFPQAQQRAELKLVKDGQRTKAQSMRDKARRLAKAEANAALPDDRELEQKTLRALQGLPPPPANAPTPSAALSAAASALVASNPGSKEEAAAEALAAAANVAAVSMTLVKVPTDPAVALANEKAEEAINAQIVWPNFPPDELQLKPATGPGVSGEEMTLTLAAVAFVEQFGDLYGVDKCSPDELWAAVNQGESSALLGKMHVGLLRVRAWIVCV